MLNLSKAMAAGRARRPPRPRSVPHRSLLPLSFLLLLPWAGSPVVGQDVDPTLLSAMEARSIGPAGMSGRIAAIDALESNPDVVFVGAATGGLWKSVNGGQTWTPRFDDQPVQSIGAVAIFPSNPAIVWVGTGEGNPRNSAGVGGGVYKSLDGGVTWTLMGLERSERIHRIVLDPTDPDVAYVGVMGPAWSDGEQRGVYRTRDGGESWERVLFVDQRTGVGDLVMDPTNPNKLFAAMWQYRRQPWFFQSGGPGSGLFVSYDGGDSWTRLSVQDGLPAGDLGRIGLAIAKSDPRVVYALVEARRSALLRSDDGGHSWRTVNDESGVASRPFYFADISVDPQNELRVFKLESQMKVSEDGGRTFEVAAEGVHSDLQALWLSSARPGLCYLGTDGGVYVSRDRGEHWQFVDNLPVGQFYHVGIDMSVPFHVYGGMQDNGSWRGPSDAWDRGGILNSDWEEVGFGDGFSTLIDPSDTTYGYTMSQNGGLVRFDLLTGERKGIRPWAPEGVTLRFNWNAALAADPFQPGTLYLGSQFVHRTDDGGRTWQIISGDLTTNDPEKQRQDESGGITIDDTGAENHTTLVSIAPSPAEREVIWGGSDDGRVHVTRSGGGDWQEVGERIGGVPDESWVSHIEASKHDGGTAYVVFDDHRRGNWKPYIYRTEDYGRHWDNIADEDQISGFVHTLEEDPVSPNLLFAGTEFGLYVSLDSGRDWIPWRYRLPAVPVRSLVVHPRDGDLVIGTHGRSIYILDDIRPLRALSQDPSILDAPIHVFSPPPVYLKSPIAVNGYHFPADAMFQGEPRPAGALLTFSLGRNVPGQPVTIEILNGEGAAIRTMEVLARPGLNRISWDLREDSLDESETTPEAASAGLEVLPGRYTVRVRGGGGESSSDVEVRPDPRREIPMAERIEKRNAVQRAVGLEQTFDLLDAKSESLAGAADRIVALLARRQGEDAENARVLAEDLRAELTPIRDGMREMAQHRAAVASMGSSRDAPTEAQSIALARLQDGLDRMAGRFNALLAGQVSSLRQAAAGLGVGILPDVDPIARGSGR